MTLILDHGRSHSPSALTRFAFTAGNALLAAGRAVARFIEREIDRRQTMALLGSDDHMLRDIGITRSDVYAALLTSSGERPSDHLSDVRAGRRQAERDQTAEARAAGRARMA